MNWPKFEMIRTLFFVCLFIPFFSIKILFSQTSYSADIDPILTENAHAVIRLSEQIIEIVSVDKMKITERLIVTVLDSKGDNLLEYGKAYDAISKISDLKYKVYNAFGMEIESVKKKDFQDYNAGGAGVSITDTRVKVAKYTPSSYPITVVFQSVLETKNTGFIPVWKPLHGYNISTEKSRYIVRNDSDSDMKYLLEDAVLNIPIEINETANEISATAENVKAVKYESLAPGFHKICPTLHIALDPFSLHGEMGNAADWNTFGQWYYDALLNQGLSLSSDVVREVKSLVSGITDPIERAARVYDYVQSRTRYISIQLGIGGWKPYPAQEVHDLGYGDCKGLTHYTRALLKAVDVESYIAVVHAGMGKKNMTPNFSKMQGNHVIVCIPSALDTVWLECTSQNSPFGYIGRFTDDRDVLIATPEGGKMVHTKRYNHKTNVKRQKTNVSISSDGSLSAALEISSSGLLFSKSGLYTYNDKEKQKEHLLKQWGHINRLAINESSHDIDYKESVLQEKLNLTAENYAFVSGNDLIFQLNAFRPEIDVPIRSNGRVLPFNIRDGYTYKDELLIQIPEYYRLSAEPDLQTIDSEFGIYTASLVYNENHHLVYKRTLILYDGFYDPDKYNAYRSFLKKVNKYENLKISITNKS